jgi:hypothetical protein
MPKFLLVSALLMGPGGHPHLVLDAHLATSDRPRVRYVGVRAARPRPDPVRGRQAPQDTHRAARYELAEQIVLDHEHYRSAANTTLRIHAEVEAIDSEAAAVAFDKLEQSKTKAALVHQTAHALVGLGLKPEVAQKSAHHLVSSGLVAEHSHGKGHTVFVLPTTPDGQDPQHELVGGLKQWLASQEKPAAPTATPDPVASPEDEDDAAPAAVEEA